MYRFVISDSLIDGIDISRVGGKRAVLDSFVYFADVLVNNSSCPETHVAHFRISHLAFWQAHISA